MLFVGILGLVRNMQIQCKFMQIQCTFYANMAMILDKSIL